MFDCSPENNGHNYPPRKTWSEIENWWMENLETIADHCRCLSIDTTGKDSRPFTDFKIVENSEYADDLQKLRNRLEDLIAGTKSDFPEHAGKIAKLPIP